jgi:hypothetical protein
MANYGLHEFSTQEATNFEAFKDWNYETKAMSGTSYQDYTLITSANPAKKVVLYQTAGDAAFDSGEGLTIKINGETAAGKEIVISGGDLPFTLSGLTITALSIKTNDATTTNDVSALSFH